MKLFESIESKWEHHCDAGMPELLNYIATCGEEIEVTKRKLTEEVNKRIPYPGVVISERQVMKNMNLLIEGNYILKTVYGVGQSARTVYSRGTGKAAPRKKADELNFELLMQWYNKNIAVGGRAQWIKVTRKEKENIRKCQTIANEHGTTIGATLSKVIASSYLMGRNNIGHYWIFTEDNFIKIIEGIYDNNNSGQQPRATAAADSGRTTQRDAERIATQRLAQAAQPGFDAAKRAEQIQKSLGIPVSPPNG